MKKKALSLALALALCLGLTVPAFAAGSDFTIENGVLTSYHGNGGAVTVPDGVTEIGRRAFYDCENLTSVTIPSSVTKIDEAAFLYCFGLTSVDMSPNVTELGYAAFHSCINLNNLVIPSGVTRIEGNTFYHCNSLTRIAIPSSVTAIDQAAFAECTGLTDVYYSGTETQWNAIEIETSYHSNDLLINATKHYNADPGLPSVTPGETPSAESDFLISDEGKLLAYDGTASKVVIPSSVKEIPSGMFTECDFLEEVTIPSSVTRIGTICFYECKNLKTVNIPSGLTNIGTYSFWGTPWLENMGDFGVVNGVLLAYHGKDKDITIPDYVSSIGNAVFTSENLNSVTLSKNTRHIGNGAFAACKNMTSVTIPAGLTDIGQDAFSNSLKDVYYGGSEAQWKAIAIDNSNAPLKSATIHYNSVADTPTIEVENIPVSGTAIASTQTVTVDGKATEFQMYALADANGNLTNYIKLRDMAYVLNGTKAQFSVGYDGIISLTTGQPYQAGGTEMTTPYSGDRAYTGGAQTVKINGKDVAMTAITLTDDNGGGYNYFKLRDLGKALGFNVSWDNGVIVESGKPYAG